MKRPGRTLLLPGISPAEFRARVSKADLAGGLYNRFLPLFVERRKFLPLPEGLGERVLDDLAGRFADSVEKAKGLPYPPRQAGICLLGGRDLWGSNRYRGR